jgi:hypothetical protein
MRDVRSLQDVAVVLRDLDDKFAKLYSMNIDLGGRRVINAGAAIDNSDYITRKQLSEATSEIRSELASLRTQLSRVEARLLAGDL